METKLCAPGYKKGYNPNYCYKTLPIEEFDWNDKSKGYRRYNCRSCRNIYCYNSYKRIWDKRGPEAKQRRNQASGKYQKKVKREKYSKINEIKSKSGCVDCGGSFPPVAMDFDHVKGIKIEGISDMIAHSAPLDRILKEIEKCELRCSNCHRIKTYEKRLQHDNRNTHVRRRAKINEIKANTPCVDCGGSFSAVAMDFDHVRGTKKYGISEMAGNRMPWDKIQKEIDKCELRCANCHRIKTYEEHQHAAINNPVLIKT